MKLGIITATRAEYGLLYPLIVELNNSDKFDVKLIVTGTHLLFSHGNTIQFIEEDGLDIHYKVPIILEENESQSSIISNATCKFDKIYRQEQFDGIIVLGDRFELFGFCIPAMMQQIPIIHLHGGEKTEGAIDESIRHAITKMATIHFPSIEEYAKRIAQLGENPSRIHPVGALGIDNIMHQEYIKKQVLFDELSLDKENQIAVVTYHPVTTKTKEQMVIEVKEVFEALVDSDLISVVTMPNIDFGGDVTREVIHDYVTKYPNKFIYRKSLGQKRYLSLLNYVNIVIGNSSSGIIEVPSFGIPTINIGDRQEGRFAPATVIQCECNKNTIGLAIEQGLSEVFLESVKGYVNPYGSGNTAHKIVEILENVNLKEKQYIKKKFFDIPVEVTFH